MDHQRFELEPLYLQSKMLTALLMRFIPEYFFFRIYIYISRSNRRNIFPIFLRVLAEIRKSNFSFEKLE